MGLGKAVIDVGTQSVQRQPALQVPLGAGDFVAIQPAANADLNSLAAEAQRRIHGFAHGAPESHTLLQLQRNVLGHELRVELRLVHFLNIDKDITIGALLDVLLQLVDFRSLAADDDTRTRGADDDAQLVARTLDLDGANARRLQLFLQLGLQLHVFQQKFVVVAHYEPARLPGLGNAEAESVWMDFLSHNLFLLRGDRTLASPLFSISTSFSSWPAS